MQPCERLLVILAQIQSLCQIYNREKMKLETPKDRKGTARIKRAGSSVLHEREALRNHQRRQSEFLDACAYFHQERKLERIPPQTYNPATVVPYPSENIPSTPATKFAIIQKIPDANKNPAGTGRQYTLLP